MSVIRGRVKRQRKNAGAVGGNRDPLGIGPHEPRGHFDVLTDVYGGPRRIPVKRRKATTMPDRTKLPLTLLQNAIYQTLTDEPTDVQTLADRARMTRGQAYSALLHLSGKDLAVRDTYARWRRTKP